MYTIQSSHYSQGRKHNLRRQILTRVQSDLSITLPKLYPDTIPTYIRLGAYDETLPDPAKEAKFISPNTPTTLGVPVLEHPQPNVRVFGLDNSHALNRIRVTHWLRAKSFA